MEEGLVLVPAEDTYVGKWMQHKQEATPGKRSKKEMRLTSAFLAGELIFLFVFLVRFFYLLWGLFLFHSRLLFVFIDSVLSIHTKDPHETHIDRSPPCAGLRSNALLMFTKREPWSKERLVCLLF